MLGKKVVLGVTGGIAVYKAPELVRRLIDHGAEVQVVMTAGACEFVKPLVFQAVSGNEVHTELLDDKAEAGMGHIELARWADIVLIAPCTANTLAKISSGFADDLLSTVCLATNAPLIVAPAMNSVMWNAAATTDNIDTLKARGVVLLQQTDFTSQHSSTADLHDVLKDIDVLLTAGPTRERIDPVRYISNHSSGKMGYALAEAAESAGANVTLVSGPVNLATPAGVTRVDVATAQDMQNAVMSRIAKDSIFISVAAVADYRVAHQSDEKIKKSDEDLTLTLVRNPDILAGVASAVTRPFCVGFAAETQNLEQYARSKLVKKNLDMIIANLVGDGRTFGKDNKLADHLIRLIAQRFNDNSCKTNS